MADFKFEGFTDDLSEEQKVFLAKVLQENGFDGGTVRITLVGKSDDNFIANVKRFEIEKNGKIFRMVAKIAPKNPNLRMLMNTKIFFNNEHVMYTEVLSKFTKLEKEVGIPDQDQFKYAKCYGSFIEEPNEIILLEDLNELNLVMLDRLKYFSNETVKLVLKNFAILHSLSYVTKDREPETYEVWTKKLNSIWTHMDGSPDVDKFFTQLENTVMMLVNNEEYKELIKGSLSNFPMNIKKDLDMDRDSRFSVIQQGDSWTNNIMFKVKDEKTTECYMIDYQMSVENNPVADILYMVLACTNYETRAKHFHEWIEYYHQELADHLSKFGLEIEQTYPKVQLETDLKRLAKTSLGNNLTLTAILLKEANETQEFKDALEGENVDNVLKTVQFENMQTNTMVRVQEKIEGVIKTFIDLGYF